MSLTTPGGGRVNPGAVDLDTSDFFVAEPDASVGQQEAAPQSEGYAVDSDFGSWHVVKAAGKQVSEDAALDGHATTDSSDSSDDGVQLSPVVGHYTIQVPEDKQLWLNQNSKMFHLSRMETCEYPSLRQEGRNKFQSTWRPGQIRFCKMQDLLQA